MLKAVYVSHDVELSNKFLTSMYRTMAKCSKIVVLWLSWLAMSTCAVFCYAFEISFLSATLEFLPSDTSKRVSCKVPRNMDPVSISDKTSRSREIGSLNYRITLKLSGTSAALLPRCLKFQSDRRILDAISRLRDFARSYNKTSYRILEQAPGGLRLSVHAFISFLIL